MDPKYIELAERIDKFIEAYAAISPNWDCEDEHSGKYTGPDPYQLLACAELMKAGVKPERCFSEWGSGCYKPYISKEGMEEHNSIVSEVCKIINSK